jgi:hypothetical protein
MSVPETEGAAPDAEALVRQVRARIAGRLSRGEYAPADLDALRRVEFEPRDRTDFGPAPADDIARLHAAWDPLGPHTFTSHRGALGAVVVAAKQLLRRLARPVAAVTLARQAAFNGAVARLLTGAAHGVQALEADAEALAGRLYELERSNRELSARCDELQAQLQRLQARLGPGAGPETPQ